MDPLKTNALPRGDIADFIKSDRGVRSYEDLQGDTTNVYEAIATSSFLTLAGSPSLGSERTLTLTADLSAVDGGPNALYTLGLSSTTVVAGSYGSAGKIAGFTVDARGRLTAAAEYALNSDNVAEGATNLYYTNARARAALSDGTGISYNSGTGVIAVSAKLALYDGGDTPSAFTLGIVDSVDAAAWRTAIGAGTSSTTGTVTSVSGSGGTTGLTLTGGAITTSGTLTLGGTLVLANGGTGSTTAAGARANLGFANGTYTPTLANVVNTSARTPQVCDYMQIGSTVVVSGYADITASAAGLTAITVSLPIASNFSDTFQANGSGSLNAIAAGNIACVSNNTTKTAQLNFIAPSAATFGAYFIFQYRVLP